MRKTISECGRAGAAFLEGFSRRVLSDSLSQLDLSAAQLGTIASMIAIRGGCDVFTAETPRVPCNGSDRSCLVDGPHRTIAIGRGRTTATFVEGEGERLSFFEKVGRAATVTLRVEAWDEHTATARWVSLTRDAYYHYSHEGHRIRVCASTREQVQCEAIGRGAGRPSSLTLHAAVFWPFVCGTTADLCVLTRAHISAAHAAGLLGLSLLTISRRIGEEKLPAVRPRSMYPGVTLAGLVEYLAYRQIFPQGHPNARRIEAWQLEWRLAYRAALAAAPSREVEGGRCFPSPQEGVTP